MNGDARPLSHTPDDVAEATRRLRRLCAHLPEVNERPSHGSVAFFVRDKRVPDWGEVAGILGQAYRLVAPKTLVRQLDTARDAD